MNRLRVLGPVGLAILLFPIAEGQVVWVKDLVNPVFPASSGNPNDPGGYRLVLNPDVIFDQHGKVFSAWMTVLSDDLGAEYAIGSGLSVDGRHWFYGSTNPVIEGSDAGFDESGCIAPRVVWDQPVKKMYYFGDKLGRYSIGLATSTDGFVWTKSASSPVLSPGPPGSWDAAGVLYFSVLHVGDQYLMWYSGRDGANSRIGLATSPDGLTWTKYPGNPVLAPGSPGSWEALYVEAPSVLLKENTFYMFYTARPHFSAQQIGMATSTDGVHWVKYAGNPVLIPTAGWEQSSVAAPSVLFHDGKFHMWYSGGGFSGWHGGYATSEPAITPVHPAMDGAESFIMEEGFPNPFNSSTTVRIGLPESGVLQVTVVDVLGRPVRSIASGHMTAGRHDVRWDGTNSGGESAPSGVYWYRAAFRTEAGSVHIRNRRVVLVK